MIAEKKPNGFKRFALGLVLGATITCIAYFFLIAALFGERERSGIGSYREGRSVSSMDESASDGVQEIDDFLHGSSNLNQEDLLDRLRQVADDGAGTSTHVMQELLIGQLARENPQKAIDEIWRFPSSRWGILLAIVFGEWSVVDLEQAFLAANGLSGWFRETAVEAILAERDDLSEEAVLNIVQPLGLEALVSKQAQEILAKGLLNEPRLAWDLVVNDAVPDAGQSELLSQIALEWVEETGFEVLDILFDSLYYTDIGLFEQVLSSVTANDFSRAFQFVMGMSLTKQKAIAPRLLGQWAKESPEQALQATSRVAHGTTRSIATSNVMYGWAQKDPSGLLRNVESLPRSMWRTAVGMGVPGLARSDPEQAAEALGRLKPIVGYVGLLTEFSLVDEWAKRDISAAKRWVDENAQETDSRRFRLMQRLLTQYALADAEKALQLARAEELSEADPSGAETHVIDALVAYGKMDAALDMLQRVRVSARLSATISIGQGLVGNGRGDEAVDLAQNVSDSERTDFFKGLALRWMEVDIEELLNAISTFPTDGTRAAVAREVLSRAEYSPRTKLTTEQHELLTTYLEDASSD